MLGDRIKEKRKAAGLTQTELGDAVGVRKNTVSDWERDKYKPDIQTIDDIANVLHTSAAYLLGYTAPDSSEEKVYYSRMPLEQPPVIKLPGQFEVPIDEPEIRSLSDVLLKRPNKKKPSTSIEVKGDEISTAEMSALLCALGYIRPGEDLRNEDLDFMTHLFGMLDAWFASRNTL